jgi:hypothetical protein
MHYHYRLRVLLVLIDGGIPAPVKLASLISIPLVVDGKKTPRWTAGSIPLVVEGEKTTR